MEKTLRQRAFASAGYAFGNTTSFSTGSNYQMALGYNGGPFNVSGFYSHANRAGFTNQSYSVGGNYTFGILRANAGYFHYSGDQGSLGQRRDNAWTVSLKLAPKGPLDYELGYQQMRVHNAAYCITAMATSRTPTSARSARPRAWATGTRKRCTARSFITWRSAPRSIWLATT